MRIIVGGDAHHVGGDAHHRRVKPEPFPPVTVLPSLVPLPLDDPPARPRLRHPRRHDGPLRLGAAALRPRRGAGAARRGRRRHRAGRRRPSRASATTSSSSSRARSWSAPPSPARARSRSRCASPRRYVRLAPGADDPARRRGDGVLGLHQEHRRARDDDPGRVPVRAPLGRLGVALPDADGVRRRSSAASSRWSAPRPTSSSRGCARSSSASRSRCSTSRRSASASRPPAWRS